MRVRNIQRKKTYRKYSGLRQFIRKITFKKTYKNIDEYGDVIMECVQYKYDMDGDIIMKCLKYDMDGDVIMN